MQRVGVKKFLLADKKTPIVDVRSPSEFMNGHIEGAINLPLFTDEERIQVGSIYNKIGKSEALERGLEIVGPKMNVLAKKSKEIGKSGKLKLHCWRGGMRSDKMAWLLELVDLEVKVLEGGYKAFRKQLLHDFQNLKHLIVLQGPTGSGKTGILQELKKKGEQVLDLEQRANHKGSAFGALGMGNQPNTAQFQNILYGDLLKMDISKRLWIESESLSIGKVYLPETLWETMNRSKVIEIEMLKIERAKRIVAEYGHIDRNLLASSIEKIKNRFGGDRVKKALELLEEGKLKEVTMLLLNYYDKTYTYSKNKYKQEAVAKLERTNKSTEQCAVELIATANKLNL